MGEPNTVICALAEQKSSHKVKKQAGKKVLFPEFA